MTLRLDANGLPLGHEAALKDGAKELREMFNKELPDAFYCLSEIDSEWVMSRVFWRYLVSLKQQQRPVLEVVR